MGKHRRVMDPVVSGGFISELHGLRGIALALVVIYHVFTGKVSGGLDVFMFLTGFLITRSMVGQLERREFSPPQFLARLGRRLVPSMAVALAGIAVGTYFFTPLSERLERIGDIIAALLFWENWRLITSSQTYGAADPDQSPVQHFWSLAVQGQFYLLWIVLLGVVVFLLRMAKVRPKHAVLVPIVIVTVVSFVYALHQVQVDQPYAYLSTWTRLWQFGLGALLSLSLPWIRRHLEGTPPVRWWLGLVGLFLVVSCGQVLDARNTFPGWQSLYPVAGAAIVLIAGKTPYRISPDKLLRTGPLGHIGDISFALYLWHWPLLIFATHELDRRVNVWEGIAVVAVSYALAWFTTEFVEFATAGRVPELDLGRARRVIAPLALTVPVVVGLFAWQQHERAQQEVVYVAQDPEHLGALADPTPSSLSDSAYIPSLNQRDLPTATKKCISWLDDTSVSVCETGDPDGETTVALVGASHVVQWYDAFGDLGKENGWDVKLFARYGCHFSMPVFEGNNRCEAWNEAVMDDVLAAKPDVVVTLATMHTPSPEETPEGLINRWETLDRNNIEVLAIRDTPHHKQDLAKCLEEAGDDPSRCDSPDDEVGLAPVSPFLTTPNIPDNVTYLDLTEQLCGDGVCPALIGNVRVTYDDEHLTRTFARTMSPYLEPSMRRTLR